MSVGCGLLSFFKLNRGSFVKRVLQGRLSEDHLSTGSRASMRPTRCSGTRVSQGSAKTVRLALREGRRDPEEYGRQLPNQSQTVRPYEPAVRERGQCPPSSSKKSLAVLP